ncbi:hypothetical protein ACIGO6_33630 [Streptomyces sp. NPDC053750]|uniref:hypothetical protein n=1 Tax=Streptomyces sp. NPDC053750 TaxID=3365714 RepID=UPI0037CD81A5
MKNLTRHLAATGIAAVTAGSALLAGGGSATAAGQPAPHTGTRAATAAGHHGSQRAPAHRHVDPWVMDQLRMFEPAAAQRIEAYDPWIKDQLAQFARPER